MTHDVYEVLNHLDQMAFHGEDVTAEMDAACRQYGTEYLAQYIQMDTFPALFTALN